MTTLNFELSSALQTTLLNASSNNVYAYAFAFWSLTENGPVDQTSWTTLFDNGTVEPSPSLTLDSPNFYSGAVYIVIQQGGLGHLPSQLTELSHFNTTLADAANFTYQLFEFTLSGSDQDQGDISALDSFALTSTLEVVYQDGTATRGFNTSASNIFDAFPADAVADYRVNQFPNAERIATGPSIANNAAPWPSSVWTSYVGALAADQSTLDDIQIVYAFQLDGGTLSQYSVQYVSQGTYGSDYFWLVPDTSNGATNTDWIRIDASELAENIFVQGGQLEYHTGNKYSAAQYYSSFTPTNPDGGVAKHFVAGFDAGFWGGSGTSPNALVTETLDFNKGYNWSVDYAYDAALLDGVPNVTYTNSLGTSSSGNFFYDPWAQQFVSYSNAYGYSYSDLVSAGGVNPQVSLWDPQANSGAGANVSTINITVYDTGETPASGFTEGSQGYIAPTAASGDYESALTQTTNQLGLDFAFSVGATTYAPNDETPIKFRIYAPDSPQADADDFISLDVTAAGGTNGDWCYYSIVNNAGTWSLQFDAATGAPGQLNIANLPATSDGSPAWYQLVFGTGDSQSIYNIYATTDTSNNNAFESVVVDHGVEVTEYSDSDYGLDFAPGGHMLYDINTFSAPPTSDPNQVGSNIKGSKKTDFVNALNTVAGQGDATGGADIIDGREGDDYLSGLGGNDTINGGKGIDMVRGNAGNDILQVRGSEGVYDFFHGGEGTDTLQFLAGSAVTLAEFDASSSSIEVLQGNGRGLLGTKDMNVFNLSGLDTISDLPFVDAGAGNDIVTGSDFADDLRGGAGDDTLNGGDGNDTLDGGKGIDALDGGADNDVLQVRGNEGIWDTFDGGTGTDTLQLIGTVTLAGFDATDSSIEIVQGSGRGIVGTEQADVFDLSGLTTITGVPFIDGRGGNDTLIGSSSADNLRGGAHDDTLDGQAGNDILDGGAGSNTYVYADGYGADRVVRYNVGLDTFDLTGVSGVSNFSELAALMTPVNGKTVLIDFGSGNTLTIDKTTIAILTANQGDFLFS